MWIFPNNTLNLFFGQGINTLGNHHYTSDIGLIQDIFMFGIVFIMLLLTGLVNVFIPFMAQMKKLFGYLFVFIFVISITAFYMKGLIFASNELVRMLFILMIFYCTIKFKNLHPSRD